MKKTATGNIDVKNSQAPVPIEKKLPSGQYESYWVLKPETEEERVFIRPVRQTYTHLACGTDTSMAIEIAETYSLRPDWYTSTFCCNCRGHFPVGENGEFVWKGTEEKVGT